MPRYSCMESAFTISPPRASASRSDNPDFPVAVGPTTVITRCGMASVCQPGPGTGASQLAHEATR